MAKIKKFEGSSGEARSQLYIAVDQTYISPNEFEALSKSAIDVSQMISGLMKYLRQSTLRGSKFR